MLNDGREIDPADAPEAVAKAFQSLTDAVEAAGGAIVIDFPLPRDGDMTHGTTTESEIAFDMDASAMLICECGFAGTSDQMSDHLAKESDGDPA